MLLEMKEELRGGNGRQSRRNDSKLSRNVSWAPSPPPVSRNGKNKIDLDVAEAEPENVPSSRTNTKKKNKQINTKGRKWDPVSREYRDTKRKKFLFLIEKQLNIDKYNELGACPFFVTLSRDDGRSNIKQLVHTSKVGKRRVGGAIRTRIYQQFLKFYYSRLRARRRMKKEGKFTYPWTFFFFVLISVFLLSGGRKLGAHSHGNATTTTLENLGWTDECVCPGIRLYIFFRLLQKVLGRRRGRP